MNASAGLYADKDATIETAAAISGRVRWAIHMRNPVSSWHFYDRPGIMGSFCLPFLQAQSVIQGIQAS